MHFLFVYDRHLDILSVVRWSIGPLVLKGLLLALDTLILVLQRDEQVTNYLALL